MSTEWMSKLSPQSVGFVLTNFALCMLCVAVFFIILNRVITWGRVSQYEITYRWVSFFAVGLTCIYAFVMHAFFPATTATELGWAISPFQYNVAMADLAMGLIAILSFNAAYSFRLATVIANTCWFWGIASGYIIHNIFTQSGTVINAGSWFWADLFIPFILLVCIGKLKNKG